MITPITTSAMAWSLLRRFWWLALLIPALLWGWRMDGLRAGYKADLAQEVRDHSATQMAFDQTVANFRTASDLAQRAADANTARVKAEQLAINERSTHDLQTRLADTAARYERLRERIAAGPDFSRPDDAPMSLVSDAACHAYAGTACDEIPARLRAAEDNTSRLIALQAWVREQAAVEVAPE